MTLIRQLSEINYLNYNIRRFIVAKIVILSVGIAIMPTQATASDDVIAGSTKGNQSSLDTIQLYYADILHVRKRNGAADHIISTRYWRTVNGIRATEQTSTSEVTELEAKGGKQQVLTLQNGKLPDLKENNIGVLITERNRHVIDSDPWEASLFNLPIGLTTKPAMAVYTLSEAVRKGTVKQSNWLHDSGRRLAHIVIECDAGNRTYEVWVDPGVNWLIRKCIQTLYENGKITWQNEFRVDEFNEIKSSIFIPVKCSSTLQFRGKKVLDTTTEVNNVRVNELLPQELPLPLYKSDVRVFDESAGIVYSVGKNGLRNGPTLTANVEYIPPSGSTIPKADPLAPTSARIWVARLGIIIAAALLFAGFIIRRRRINRIESFLKT